MDTEKIKQLKKIFKSAIKRFKYVTDQERYGQVDRWVLPVPGFRGRIVGDCEDFALYCRKLCRAAGFKTRLVYCNTESGEAHCVLYIKGYIMDNRHLALQTTKSLKKLGYKFIAISSLEKGGPWKIIKGTV